MRKLARAALPLAAAATALMLTATVAQAAAYQSSDRWASYNNGGYTIYNDEWGSGYGSQTLWANTYKDWGVYSTQPATSGVKSYANVSRSVGTALNSLSSSSSTYAVSLPGTGDWEAAYDIWLNGSSYEVMLWVDRHGNVGPLGSSIGNLSLDGRTWTVYVGSNGANPVYSFVQTSNTTSGTVNILNLLKWMENTKHYFSNPTLSTIQFGFEISGTGNTRQDFTVTNYSATAS